ncbi:MAG TPA: diaminopimelate epimerase, partial [Gammaproteobacteria bacterium]|nr:diaminopimelate epimerase [Gammaproteobacteria bacterium]
MTGLAFTKMHGLGNDFVVLDGLQKAFTPTAAQLQQLTNRREGVGCDQVLLINPARDSHEDFSVRIFNADGSEVEQCGNGMRCVATWLAQHKHVAPDAKNLRLGSKGGAVEATLLAPDQVRINMGIPELEPANIPFDAPHSAVRYAVDVDNQTVDLGAVSMGNPHAVIRVPDVVQAPVAQLGPALVAHARFPNGVNVGFLQIINRRQIRLRVFERGAGETRACGSGACAAVVWA